MTETFAATSENTKWEPLTPEQVRDLFRDVKVPWYIAGGWALDLYLGRASRSHTDIDVAVYRQDLGAIRKALGDWELFIAESGTLTPWRDGELPKSAHELWCRERGKDAWQLEILVEERSGDRWTYRRDPDVGLRASDIGRTTSEGIPYLRPEIQLLYKSKDPRPVDETDFLTLLPRLDPAQKAFLSAGIWTTAPRHRWLGRLG